MYDWGEIRSAMDPYILGEIHVTFVVFGVDGVQAWRTEFYRVLGWVRRMTSCEGYL